MPEDRRHTDDADAPPRRPAAPAPETPAPEREALAPPVVWAVAATLVGAGLVAAVWLGTRWDADTPVVRIEVVGARYAPADSLRALVRLDSGATMGRVQPPVVADRVRRHPWVEAAVVTRRAGGVVRLAVTERTPVALALDADGRPAAYLDRHAHALPLPPRTAAFDVPLVRGLDRLHDTTPLDALRPAAPPTLAPLLATLATHPADTLVAEVEVSADSSLALVTRPLPEYGPLAVRLPTGPGTGFREPLDRLYAFWDQVLVRRELPRPIREIDLRFDRQVVTR